MRETAGQDTAAPQTNRPLLSVGRLGVAFGQAPVIRDLSFDVAPGRTVAIVGESGSGKSVTSLSIMRLADLAGARFTGGRILFRDGDAEIDLLAVSQGHCQVVYNMRRFGQLRRLYPNPA